MAELCVLAFVNCRDALISESSDLCKVTPSPFSRHRQAHSVRAPCRASEARTLLVHTYSACVELSAGAWQRADVRGGFRSQRFKLAVKLAAASQSRQPVMNIQVLQLA